MTITRILLTSTIIASISFSNAFAGSNNIVEGDLNGGQVSLNGNGNSVNIAQVGNNETAVFNQNGDATHTTITQGAAAGDFGNVANINGGSSISPTAGSTFAITQTGSLNSANISSAGTKDTISIAQNDSAANTTNLIPANQASITSNGNNNALNISQTGLSNTGSIDAAIGSHTTASITQNGNENDAKISTNQVAYLNPNIDTGNVASISQTGNLDSASIFQAGLMDKASIIQVGSNDVAHVLQNGNNNTLKISQ